MQDPRDVVYRREAWGRAQRDVRRADERNWSYLPQKDRQSQNVGASRSRRSAAGTPTRPAGSWTDASALPLVCGRTGHVRRRPTESGAEAVPAVVGECPRDPTAAALAFRPAAEVLASPGRSACRRPAGRALASKCRGAQLARTSAPAAHGLRGLRGAPPPPPPARRRTAQAAPPPAQAEHAKNCGRGRHREVRRSRAAIEQAGLALVAVAAQLPDGTARETRNRRVASVRSQPATASRTRPARHRGQSCVRTGHEGLLPSSPLGHATAAARLLPVNNVLGNYS